MLPIKFTYLFYSCLFFIPWFLIFIKRKDLRKLMILNGLFALVLGSIINYFYWIKDWWQPHSITGTRFYIEDLLLGFGSGGVSASLYLYVFNKKLVTSDLISKKRLFFFLALTAMGLIFFLILIHLLRMSSFMATLIVGSIVYLILAFLNKTLIKASIINSFLMFLLVIPIYMLAIFVTPGFIEKTWMMNNLMGIKFFGVPIEDYIFYLITGAGSFFFYPFLFKFKKLKNT